MSSLLLSFILDANSSSVSQPKAVAKPVPSSVPLPPKSINLSKPVYRNDELERLIAKEKTSTKLDLHFKELTAQDAEIVAYYALYIHKVSIIESSVIRG
jgi:hypothetical protein